MTISMRELFFREYTKYTNTWNFTENISTKNYFEINNNTIEFKFCGFLSLDNYLICVFPKGFSLEGKDLNILRENAQLLIKVLKKYNQKSIQYTHLNTHNKERFNNNYISLAYEITRDYKINGLITQTIKTQNINGPGKTNWNKTIKNQLPIITNNSFMYMELINEKTLKAMSSELIQIHWLILKDIQEKIGWLLEFQVSPIQRSIKKLNVIRAKSILKKTINTTFNQTLIRRLKLLYQYIDENFYGDYKSNNSFRLLYTFNFHNVWEEICKNIYEDLAELHELVPKYKWTKNGEKYKETSIIPDILTYYNHHALLIIDAKYYPELEERSGESKLPQSGDISKQFIYRKALSLTSRFIDKCLYNIFVLPGVVSETENFTQEIAKVSFENPLLFNDLQDIIAFQIHTEQAMRDYLVNSIQLKLALTAKLQIH